MVIDKTHEQYEEMQLFYDVMEIGLAVMGSAAQTTFFRFIDRALDTFNIAEMRLIKDAFDALHEDERHALIDGEPDSARAVAALKTLQVNCRVLARKADIKIA
ncbi:MAG: hypothetical protein HY342_07660 [Candidatus Lambdaproteobacteria bacterium]|nr:hypothetical protein [Candidatus Lambdaproteobacteria bacterium]